MEGRCFNYGQLGHSSKFCPQKMGRGVSTPTAQIQALDATPSSSGPERGRKVTVEGWISISDFSIRTLFDSGASHSFISSSLVDCLHLDISLVVNPIVVSNPIG